MLVFDLHENYNLNRQQIQILTEQDVSGSSRFRGCGYFLGSRLQLTGVATSRYTINLVFFERSHFKVAPLIFSTLCLPFPYYNGTYNWE